MTKTIGSIPVKSRVPLAAWAFAGLLTLLSTLPSLVNLAVGPDRDLSASASKNATTTAKEARHASVNW
jgi:hypothetical protein